MGYVTDHFKNQDEKYFRKFMITALLKLKQQLIIVMFILIYTVFKIGKLQLWKIKNSTHFLYKLHNTPMH